MSYIRHTIEDELWALEDQRDLLLEAVRAIADPEASDLEEVRELAQEALDHLKRKES